ncbi:ARM repeat-containing protein [Dentipellis sp. KUC8613]|nr:ARM repeat-containing protein [Dentipellis sp. KUC8613]
MEDGDLGYIWQRERVSDEWPQALEHARRQLLTSKTRVRVNFLQEGLLPLAKHENLSLSQVLDVFKLLTETYPRYVDSASKEAVEAVGVEMVRRDEVRDDRLGVTEQILGWVSNEVGRISKRANSYAPADLFVLLSWCCGLYIACVKSNPLFSSSVSWNKLVGSIAVLLDLLLNPSTRAKPAIQKSALVRTRRALRSAPPLIRVVMKTLLALSKSLPSPLVVIPLLGVSVDVTTRLKNVKDASLTKVPDDVKAEILSVYSSVVLMSRTPVPNYISESLRGFIETLSESDFKGTVLPTMEKALLRSPEHALLVVSDFFLFYPPSLDSDDFRRILTPTLNSAKSANALVRSGAVSLFRVVVEKKATDESKEHAVTELLNLAKAGKSVGPDRQILYSMLGFLNPSTSVSDAMIKTVPALLAKETNEAAIPVLGSALTPHLAFYLQEGKAIPSDVVATFVKEMQSQKPVIRRAFVTLVGDAFWELENLTNDAAKELAKATLPAFEASLKTVASNPLNSAGGPLEGYVAAGVLLGPFSRSGAFEDVISRNATIQSIVSASKPSFLLWDKVYQKSTSTEEETWLLRAVESVLVFFHHELLKSDHLRSQLGLVFLHLATDGKTPESRRLVTLRLEHLNTLLPKVVNGVVHDALKVHLTHGKSTPPKAANGSADDEKPATNKQPRVLAFLLSTASFSDDVELDLREEMLTDQLVLGHHPLICGKFRQPWIELCQKAKVDPGNLVEHQIDRLLKVALSTSLPSETAGSEEFNEASYRALTTLAFVSSDLVLPKLIDQLRADINSGIQSLTDSDFGIWATPEGTTYVDVLSKKPQVAQTKGKDAEIAKWEAEVRKNIASKKAGATPTLSKQEQALVKAQLEKETQIRQHVASIQGKLKRALQVISHLVYGNIEGFQAYVSDVAGLLLGGGVLHKGSPLIGRSAFDTYLDLSHCCSERLETFGRWIGIATLRSLDVPVVPEDFAVEPINQLILRVLYRLRFLSEQAPLDSATFSYAFPLLHQVLLKGGIGLTEEDDPIEQVALSLDIIKFHCGELGDKTFPRVLIMEAILHAMRHQLKLSKDASSALIDMGEAIYPNATSVETDILLHGTLLQEAHVRTACLQALQPFDLTEMDWSPELLIAAHDEDEQNARLARHLWEDNGLDVPESYLPTLQKFLDHDNAYVRSSVAVAFTEAVEHWPQSIHDVVAALEALYREKAKILAPEFDQYGMLVEQSLDRQDPWQARLAIALTLQLLAPAFGDVDVVPFFEFLVNDEALGDRNADVRRGMLDAGAAVIDLHGSTRLAELISMFETHLAGSHPTSETADFIQEAIVILFGRVARHLDPTDARLPAIVSRLVEALKTPSEQVQFAVSDCLAPLVKITKSSVPKLVDQLFDELFNAPKYAARRGAAYGLAGVIKGMGISGMKEFDILGKLRTATEDKKRYEPRQGAMFLLETFSSTLGRLFEPFAIHAQPFLLSSFGDSIPDVREAASDAAKTIMRNMSGYGVKLILPDLLSGLDEKQWRTKKGSIELLGMMAYCAPRQLSQSLPIIIPRLTGVLTDSHAQVRAAANKSLKQFGEVISNPEVQALVPTFLKAMVDPSKTPNALSALLKTSFVHYIDHSSLALVIPILERGLRERSADTKRKAAQIVGNLASLTDSKDFVPYMPTLLPMVHVVLVDPVPEARATAAKALGTLVERLGEVNFPDLVPSLIRTLKTDTSGVDRQGAAQGLSEVLSGLGMERLEGLLPDIIANAQSPRSTVKEGFMSLLVFLPATFGTRFQPHLPKIIPPILGGLSDTEEYVREAAMRAGRMIVTNYSSRAIDLLLPELEQGMFDPGWRIRQSSITLVGELLFKVSGISGKAEIEEDEEGAEVAVAESSRKALVEVLGAERRDRILSALYLARQDAVHSVRQSSIHIWKALVHNTPRTVREILSELITQIILLLSSTEVEQQETAARTTTEICRKFGERIVGDVVAILRSKASSPDARTREGVCLTICEVLNSSNETQQENNEDDIISMVRASLVDDEANVRSAAARAFDVLQERLGVKAIDQTIPTLLEALRQPGESSGTALQALKEVMNVRASTVFPVLIPTLIATPMSVFNARALASLVTVAGNALSKRLTVILSALVKVQETLDDEPDEELNEAVDDAIRALLASIDDNEGLNTLMLVLLGWVKHDSPRRRVSASQLFSIFCEVSELDSSLYRVDWIRQLVSSLDDRDVAVHTAAWSALDVFVKSVPKDELEPLVVPLRRTIEGTGGPHTTVPGFSLPKGVAPFVPIIIAGLTTGSNEQREQAAYAIGDLVERTDEAAIKPFVVPFTGPLIRVATQATTYPPAVKTGILNALTTMLERIPAFVKPFFPQLQRTFVKSASDAASVVVRTRAAQALGVLMKNQPRVDPVVTELITGARANDDGIAASLVLALANVIRSGGKNVGDKAKEACVELVSDAFKESHDESYMQSVAALFAAISVSNEQLVQPIVETYLIGGTPPSVLSSRCILAVLSGDEDTPHLEIPHVFQPVIQGINQKIQESIGTDKPNIARPAREARDLLKKMDESLAA